MTYEEIEAEIAKVQAQVQPLEARLRELKKQRDDLAKRQIAAGLKPRSCCNVETNLALEGPPTQVTGRTARGEVLTGSAVVRRCKVCGASHHEVTADPGHFGVRGASI